MNATEIIEAFKQGKAGNCVSIAVIKAAIRQYGIDGVFRKVERLDDKYLITMRDGFEVLVREHEIPRGRAFSKFNKGKDEAIREKAWFYFTAMAKRVYVEGAIDVFLGRNTLKSALKSLNNGENYTEGITWLGLDKSTKKITINEVDQYPNIIAASPKHCFLLADGNLIDRYGKATPRAELADNDFFELKYLVALV